MSVYKHIYSNNIEQAAFLLAGVSRSQQQTALLVREIIVVPPDGFIKQSGVYLEIDPAFMAPIIKKARINKLSVISLHSHPFSGSSVGFSGIDDRGEAELISKIQQRVSNIPHATMVFGQSSVDARIWYPDSCDPVPVDVIKIIGRTIREVYPTSSKKPESEKLAYTYDRQIPVFSKEIQEKIQRTRVGMVGLSGTGSHVFQELARLGIRKFVVIDKDIMEDPNLSRNIGSTIEDVRMRRPKTEIIKRIANDVNPKIEVQAIHDIVEKKEVSLALREVDVIFGCTDNLTSRLVLNRLAFQYLIPLIDMGIDIELKEEGKIRTAGGRVMVITPDEPCLSCLGIITPEALQQEKEIQSGYVKGNNIADPAVVSFNGAIASLAVTEFIDLLTCFERRKEPHTYQIYDILKGTVWREKYRQECGSCGICSEIKGIGDNEPLPEI
jgi:molybdopterin-synthase adenylyltransferase